MGILRLKKLKFCSTIMKKHREVKSNDIMLRPFRNLMTRNELKERVLQSLDLQIYINEVKLNEDLSAVRSCFYLQTRYCLMYSISLMKRSYLQSVGLNSFELAPSLLEGNLFYFILWQWRHEFSETSEHLSLVLTCLCISKALLIIMNDKARIEILVNLCFRFARGKNITLVQTTSIQSNLLTNGLKNRTKYQKLIRNYLMSSRILSRDSRELKH